MSSLYLCKLVMRNKDIYINSIGLSSQCRTGVLNTSYNTLLVSVAEKGMLCCVR